MADLIVRNFKGTTITLALTGLPILITGEVIEGSTNIVALRLENGNKVYIAGNLIAFFY